MNKICSICPENGEQDIAMFQRFVRRRYNREEVCYTPACKKCRNKNVKRNWEKHKSAIYKWRESNREHITTNSREWARKHAQRMKDWSREYYYRIKEELPDWYIAIQVARSTDGDLTRYEIPKEIIEIKRKQIKLIRDVKEISM